MTPPRRISLIGFSGTGKSTVAGIIAERLGWQALDSDQLIEAQTGNSIPDIFAQGGEKAFRELEVEALKAALTGEDIVLAAGGGAVLLPDGRRALASSLIVCLEATTETIVRRLDQKASTPMSGRPLLATGDPATQVRRLKVQRSSFYALADFTIHTDSLSPEEVAHEIIRFQQLYGERSLQRISRETAISAGPANSPAILDAPGATSFVRAASAEYPAYASWGALAHLGEYTLRATDARRAFVISDSRVLSLWGENAIASLRSAGMETATFTLPPGDASKSLENAGTVYDWLASQRAERRDAIVALGGGMVNDFAGFVAATYMRGMPVVQVPTSLLAMVDASIGGKTAVNQAGAKNLVGVFYQPAAVVADVSTLTTLPRRELVEGMGEVIKHALIRDPELLQLLEERLDDLLILEPDLTTQIIARNVQIKADVVSEDERETGGIREILNYGHTLGHAFEAAGDYEALLHGEAVAIGMVAAAEIGKRIGVTPAELEQRQNRLIDRAGLPLRPPAGLDRKRIQAALALDKKIIAGTQRWVLMEDVGRPVVRADVPFEVVEAVLDYLASPSSPS